MSHDSVLPFPGWLRPGTRAYIRVSGLDREKAYDDVSGIADEVGPEFDAGVYRQQMEELDAHDKAFDDAVYEALRPCCDDERIERAVKVLNLPFRARVNTSNISDEDAQRLVEKLSSIGGSGEYASTNDWSDEDEARCFLGKEGWIQKVGKWIILGGIPFVAGLGWPMSAAATQNDGMVVVAWDKNPVNQNQNMEAYRLYTIKEDELHDNPELYNPVSGGDIKYWRMDTELYPKTYMHVFGLEPGRIYLSRVTAVNEAHLESDYSNEIRYVASLRGNVCHDSPSENVVDGYDWNFFSKAYGHYYESPGFVLDDVNGDGEINDKDLARLHVCDLDGDGDVDRNDGAIMWGNMNVWQPNDMVLVYVDHDHVPETEL